MGTGAGLVASSLIGLGGSLYSAKKQSDALEEAEKKQEDAARLAEQEAKRIFEATKPVEPTAALTFGTDDDSNELGSYGEFLVSKPKSSAYSNPYANSLGFGS